MTNEDMVQRYNTFCIAKGLELQGSISRNQSVEDVFGDILSALHAKSKRSGIKQGYNEGYSYGYDKGIETTNAAHDPDGNYCG